MEIIYMYYDTCTTLKKSVVCGLYFTLHVSLQFNNDNK